MFRVRAVGIIAAATLSAAVAVGPTVNAAAAVTSLKADAPGTSKVSCSSSSIWLRLQGSLRQTCYTGNGALVVDLPGVYLEQIVGTHEVCLEFSSGGVMCAVGPGIIRFGPARVVGINISTPG